MYKQNNPIKLMFHYELLLPKIAEGSVVLSRYFVTALELIKMIMIFRKCVCFPDRNSCAL